MTNPDYRALCAELAEELVNEYGYCTEWEKGLPLCESNVSELLTRARALLAQPVAEGPTDEELLRLAREWNSGFESIELHFAADYARAVLAKWGTPTPFPLPMTESTSMTNPTDEEIMELMPQQMHDDLAAAARALAEQAGTDSRRAMGIMRIILNRHAVDHARAAIAKYGTPTPQPVAQEEDCPGCEGTPVASNSPCAVCGRAVLAKWSHPTPQPVVEWEPMPLPGDAEGLAEVFWAQPVAEGPTIPSSTLHRQELTPSEVTLLNTFWRSR